MLSRVRNEGRDIDIEMAIKRGGQGRAALPFCIVSYPWLFTTESKQRILKEYIKFEQSLNLNLWLMTDIWSA